MRNRLIEKLSRSKKGTLGYTLMEMLTVVGIIAVVCAIALPAIVWISQTLRFKQHNDYAKSIFMAAQQNLTEMRSDGGLKPLQDICRPDGVSSGLEARNGFPGDNGPGEYFYTHDGHSDAFDLVLPAGSIDATLRSEQIIIEYNPYTGNVYSVFYSEEADQSIVFSYSESSLPRDAEARRPLMLGYYDGSELNSSTLKLNKTMAEVFFLNEQEGVVEVHVHMPDSYLGLDSTTFANALQVDLTITGETSMSQSITGVVNGTQTASSQAAGNTTQNGVVVADNAVALTIKKPGQTNYVFGPDGRSIVVSCVIDSLADQLSFANFGSETQKTENDGTSGNTRAAGEQTAKSLTEILSEDEFKILPGENVTIQADISFADDSGILVEVEPGILAGVNPMFGALGPDGKGGYVLTLANGRNLQNLNALAPSIAKKVSSVNFAADIDWQETVNYYNEAYGPSGGSYTNTANEAPARALPYFVPIHHEDLFGTAQFIYPTSSGSSSGGLWGWIQDLIDRIENALWGSFSNVNVPTLTDELDSIDPDGAGAEKAPEKTHASIHGDNHRVYNLNIDSTKYQVPNGTATDTAKRGKFYATGKYQVIDYNFTGLFGYVNTTVDALYVVNPMVKGMNLTGSGNSANNPATGALLGAGGYNTLVTNCGTYIDKGAAGYSGAKLARTVSYEQGNTAYGVKGEGAVGGLVGYAKSHRDVTGELTNDTRVLAFSKCFAALPVDGNMRSGTNKDFGYSNGVGGFIGNSQLTNFYNCYASGNVTANGCYVKKNDDAIGSIGGFLMELLGMDDFLLYSGRAGRGAGGFVGTSHGTRYTNCFASGNVSATNDNSSSNLRKFGAGGFVGFMSIDETRGYGNNDEIAQRTVFRNCYSAGKATMGGTPYENFSGANGRIAYTFSSSSAYLISNYYYLPAPRFNSNTGTVNISYEDVYLYRDTYYLSQYHQNDEGEDAQENSNNCAEPASYAVLSDLPGSHEEDSEWTAARLSVIKNTRTASLAGIFGETYGDRYFDRGGKLEAWYKNAYAAGFPATQWMTAARSTHAYFNSGVYPFSKLANIPYYGDWPSEPSAMGLAYHEEYQGDTNTYYLFDKEYENSDNNQQVNKLALKNGENDIVVSDGYSIFSSMNDRLKVTIETTVTSGTETQTKTTTETLTHSGNATVRNQVYYVYDLTDTLMAAGAAGEQFYAKVTAVHVDANGDILKYQDGRYMVECDPYTMYFNSDVAASHINPMGDNTDASNPGDSSPTEIRVRSARQFKAISDKNLWYYTVKENDTEKAMSRNFLQELNIDAIAYNWADETDANGNSTEYKDTPRLVSSIGSAAYPFNGTYTTGGGSLTQASISGFTMNADKKTTGFFGTIGTDGKVSNLKFQIGEIGISSTEQDVGVVAGTNLGAITNVDLNLSGNVTLQAAANAGLMAGFSSGTIAQCDVTQAAETLPKISLTAPAAGGFAGKVAGSAEKKTAVTGSSLTLGDATTKATNAGGFLGQAEYASLDKLTVTLDAWNAEAAYAGGLAGAASNSEVTSSEVTLNGEAKNTLSTGTMAGLAGKAENTVLTAVNVKANTITGNVAVGYVGEATGVRAQNSQVDINAALTGTAAAAGVANTMGLNSDFNAVNVDLSGAAVTVTAAADETLVPTAAGYVISHSANSNIRNSAVTLGTTTISGDNAAGFAGTISGTVSTSVVKGKAAVGETGGISGNNAAGFVLNVDTDARITGCGVTPALTDSDYAGNANANLTVNGTAGAAGFALNVSGNATVENSYTLCKLTGAASGFASANAGAIEGCTANVDITGGSAFVGANSGTVVRCYGWYNGSNVTDALTEGSQVYSSYFADLGATNNGENDKKSVVLYSGSGEARNITPSALQVSGITFLTENTDHKWYPGATYTEYPYDTTLTERGEEYIYPMLRDHYGDWVAPAQFAHGVAYYESYADGSMKLHIADFSNDQYTEEKQNVSAYATAVNGTVTPAEVAFTNDGVIVDAGYLVFANANSDILSGVSGEVFKQGETNLTYTVEVMKDGSAVPYSYAFYKMNANPENGIVNISSGSVHSYFADAINVAANQPYQVRTAEQFANVAKVTSGNFLQTHDIAVENQSVNMDTFKGTYDGNDLKLDVKTTTADANASVRMGKVEGTVRNLNLNLMNGMTQSVFGTVSGKLENVDLTVANVNIAMSGNHGLLVNEVMNSAMISGCDVKAAENGAVSVTLSGSGKFGGIAGVSAGNLSGNNVNANIAYDGDAAGNVIGGLVGEMTAGTLKDSAAGGSVVLAEGVANAGTNYIGGAIGKMNKAEISNITLNVSVDANWATTGDGATFANKITDHGPVGMFVGYAEEGAISNCSNEAVNSKYQFLGEAKIITKPYAAGVWKSTAADTNAAGFLFERENDPNQKIEDVKQFTDGTVTMDLAEGDVPYVCVALSECFFDFGGTRKQITDSDFHYYSQKIETKDTMTITGALTGSFTGVSNNLTFDDAVENADDDGRTEYFVRINNDGYRRMYITKVENDKSDYESYICYTYSVWWEGLSTPHVFEDVYESGLFGDKESYGEDNLYNSLRRQINGIYLLNQPSPVLGAKYLVASGIEVIKDGKTTPRKITVDGAEVDLLKTNSTYIAPHTLFDFLRTESEISGVTLCAKDYYSTSETGVFRDDTKTEPWAFYTSDEYMIFAVQVDPGTNYLVSFTSLQENADYIRQYVTYTPKDTVSENGGSTEPTTAPTESADNGTSTGSMTPEETTTPTGETTGGETQPTNP